LRFFPLSTESRSLRYELAMLSLERTNEASKISLDRHCDLKQTIEINNLEH
jgi:hypothetical protein